MTQDSAGQEPPHDVVFIGSSALGLARLAASGLYRIGEVLCLATRVTEALTTEVRHIGVPLRTFEGRSGLRAVLDGRDPVVPFFIYQLDMLVPGDLTERFRFFNVHRGDLLTNRGPNPDIWPILNGDSTTAMSLHRINDKVDAGWFIDAVEVPIGPEDDTVAVRNRMEEALPHLIVSLSEYLRGARPATELKGGTYRPWITEADFTIDPAVDSVQSIDRKIRSQRQYNGALLRENDQRYYVVGVQSVTSVETPNSPGIEVGEETILLRTPGHNLMLTRNRRPRHPPPPLRPPSRRI